ncbi:MAG: Octopine transport system permease protein OccM [Candidatus Erwinia impunctatus]|nr:Octopine transport system permease protein OccM [Culicoides impunctatus]
MGFQWNYLFSLFSDADFWWATWTVVKLSILTWLCSIALGFLLALAKQSQHRALTLFARGYIWLFRSTPLLVLLIFVYNLPQSWPSLSGIFSNAFYSGLIAMVLSETAYMAEIHLGGLLAIPKGQYEAGRALGFSFAGIQRKIVIP